MTNIISEMTKARTELVLKYPFFGKLALGLEIIESDKFDTMATDGQRIYYNPEWTKSITHQERVGVIAHEILHVVYKHHLRRGKRDGYYWNVAGDYVINDILLEDGFILPEGGLHNSEYASMQTEKVYDLVYQESKDDSGDDASGGDGDGDDSGDDGKAPSWGEVIDAVNDDGGSLSDADIKELEREINVSVLQAVQSAKGIGGKGSAFQKMIESVKQDKVDWEDVLANHMLDNLTPCDYNFNNPDRRFIYQDMYLPSVEKEPNQNIAIAIDTSGSIYEDTKAMFLDAINNIITVGKPNKVSLIYCDDHVQEVKTFYKGEKITLDHLWGGCTDYEPVFKYIDKELDNDISYLVYLTDGYCYCDRLVEPDYPVIWATTEATKYFTFGEIVDVE
tara:strand:+ start:38 stop:1213 length:1176 start_codon:yes stop_codon:yes gene_type:complete